MNSVQKIQGHFCNETSGQLLINAEKSQQRYLLFILNKISSFQCSNYIFFSFRDRRTVHTTWERLGVKGPKASSLFLGNLGEVFTKGKFKLFLDWTEKYGKVFGYYEGDTPTLVVADPDMVRDILIKQFNTFDSRRPFLNNLDTPFTDMFIARGNKWKRIRSLTTPTFSAKKMKMMSPLIHQSIDKLMNRLEQRAKDDKDFDIYGDFQCLTLDVIASTVFSYDTDTFNTTVENNPFLHHIQKVFDLGNPDKTSMFQRAQAFLFFSFPGLLDKIRLFLPDTLTPPFGWLRELAGKMIKERQFSGEVRPDYIQLMLDSLNETDGNESGSATDTDFSEDETAKEIRHNSKTKFLTFAEMQGQIVLFLAAGYETTATTLAWAAYFLALNQQVQKKMQQEIDEFFPTKNHKINYETVQKLPYLDMVFSEVSRLAYIGQVAVQRICNETTQIGHITIPKGTKVQINVADIHINPDLWGPEPVDQFVPERFLPERKGNRHPMAYLPFGAGPKNCIGMRFAIMEAKMALINMMLRYNVVKCDKTQVPITCNTDGVHGPANGVYVRLTKRY